MSRKLRERRRFRRFLKELGLLTEFRRELKEAGNTIENTDRRSVEDKLMVSFTWSETKKGLRFWNNLYEKIEQLEKEFQETNKKTYRGQRKLDDNNIYMDIICAIK